MKVDDTIAVPARYNRETDCVDIRRDVVNSPKRYVLHELVHLHQAERGVLTSKSSNSEYQAFLMTSILLAYANYGDGSHDEYGEAYEQLYYSSADYFEGRISWEQLMNEFATTDIASSVDNFRMYWKNRDARAAHTSPYDPFYLWSWSDMFRYFGIDKRP